jgi:4-hydroxyproline epimerase
MHAVTVIDSHTAGEPTRVVVAGGPDLGHGTVADQLAVLRDRHDRFRSAVVNEPRGSDVLVGALLCEPADPACAAGVVFFNNVGYLGMCGHGTIGVVRTLAHLGRLGPGAHDVETPVGVVTTTLAADGPVAVENVPSWRAARGVTVDVPGVGPVTGDVAWGGNWFFLVDDPELDLSLANVDALVDRTWRIRRAVNAAGHPEVDHVELCGPISAKTVARPAAGAAFAAATGKAAAAGGRNFVLCPGKAYDRSPCGTGTSAKLACLAADGKLAAGDTWVQQGILGTQFAGSFRWLDRSAGKVVPSVTGTAYITGESKLLLDPADPFCWGIGAG